ncbi:adenosylcobinamide-GDP ribazoletransferase [Yoonia sp. 2307UL14-13]
MRPGDIVAAIGLLSRLPVPVDGERVAARGAAAGWAYPLAGLVVGVMVAAVASLAVWMGVPGGVAAALALATSVIITGAMHEDGLADSADGLWGGWDRDRRLEIMKDSRIGVYGVSALMLSFLIRWLALAPFVTAGLHWPVILTVAMVSRTGMVGVMALLQHARDDGLSRSVGRPSPATALIAILIAAVPAVYFWNVGIIMIACVVALTTLVCALIAKAKIGGQTGDILGATQQMVEMAVLLTLLVLISS